MSRSKQVARRSVSRTLPTGPCGVPRFLPRVMQIGLRNVGRRKRRSLATALIVALAVGNLLAVLALSQAATLATRSSWADHLEDVQISTGGRALFDERAQRVIGSTPGVAEAEPVLKNTVALEGREAFVWGVEQAPLFRYRMDEGRWFTGGEEQARDRVAVIERNIAQNVGVNVGDRVALSTAAGNADFRIVGIAKNQQEDGTALFIPLTTARSLLGEPAGASSYWIKTEAPDAAFVDHATNLLEDRLAGLGYEVTSEIKHVAEQDEVAANRTLTTTIALLGFVIVAMSMVGLANAITTTCSSARARSASSAASALALATFAESSRRKGSHSQSSDGSSVSRSVTLLDRLLVWLVWKVVDVRLPVVFPPWNLLIVLVGTVALALIVLFLPVRRAVRFRPGDALRYV